MANVSIKNGQILHFNKIVKGLGSSFQSPEKFAIQHISV